MNSKGATFFVLVLSSLFINVFSDELVVRLNHGGELRGSTLKTQKGRTIYAFRGIPYAEPPIGQQRFKDPIAKSAWTSPPLDAIKDGPVCPHIYNEEYVGQEDCLYLNVYTTKDLADSNHNGTKMAVMVWIHGGGFTTGGSVSYVYGPGLLLDEDVILVTLNYRLGPLGFLSTRDSASPGNFGLKDQSLALKWVNDNIDVFGGDVNQITIFGESAGGASVGFQLLSPMSKGLFHRVISQSGSPFCPWAIQKDPVSWTEGLAADFNCSTDSTAVLVECLRQIPAEDIIKLMATNSFVDMTPFLPIVGDDFLPMEPHEILSSGNLSLVPYLGGLNKDEALIEYSIIYLNSNSSTIKNKTEENLNHDLDFHGKADEAVKVIMEKYTSQLDWTDEETTRQAVVKMISDGLYNMPHYEMMKSLIDNGFQTYSYSFDFVPSVSIIKDLGINKTWGTSHADDLGFLFDGSFPIQQNANEDDRKIMNVFCSLWTNFAKYGDPTPNTTEDGILKWELSNKSVMNIYHIDNPVTTSVYKVDSDDLYDFWTEVVPGVLNETIPYPS